MTIDLEMFKKDWDWQEVLAYAGKDPCLQGQQPAPSPSPVTDSTMDCAPFGMADVAEVLHAREGDHDGPSWLVVLRLNDGRFAYIEAGCDYTGWDCQAGGSASVARTLPELIRFGMPEESRKDLGLKLS